ncbi:MAG: CpsB/CapC family capsule biosynthesis tyrosine phosphatase [Acidobacteriota bacterium]
MIDIHSHILFQIDDGARTLDESLEMCRMSARDGVTTIVATPHAHDGVHQTHDPAHLRQKVDELNELLQGEPRIVLGSELRFTHDVVNHLCNKQSAPTLAGTSYALIEFPHQVVPPGSERALFELMNNGIRPIIAHPERNVMLMGHPEKFFELVELGALGQADTGSFTGQFGSKVKETAIIMLENGLLHFVASDCHNLRNRLPGLSMAMTAISELVGEEYAQAMSKDNPGAIIEDRAIPTRPAPVLPQKKKRWLFF